MQLDFSLAGPCATVDKCHLAAQTNSFRLMVVMRIFVFCVIVVLTLFCVLFVFENSSFANFMAFVLIWDCCILCDSVCSGPADYVNLMGEGRRYHNCSVPTNALGCDTVVSYCVCVVG